MKVLRFLVAVASLVGAFLIGKTAAHQFENYQEWGTEYLTPFHVFNLVILALVAVALAVFAISALIGKVEENRAFLEDYLKAVFLGTAGVVAIAVGWYEGEVNNEEAFPYIYNAYHSGDMLAVWAVGVTLLGLAAYYLLRDNDDEYEYVSERSTSEEVACCESHVVSQCCDPYRSYPYPVVPPYLRQYPYPYAVPTILIIDLSSLVEEAEEDLPDFEVEVKGTYETEDGDLRFEATIVGNYPQAQSFDDELAAELLSFFLSGGGSRLI